MRLHLLVVCATGLALLRGSVRADTLRLPCVADCGISSFPGEQSTNYGGASRIRLKGIQMLGLLRFDLGALGRRPLTGATLHLRHANDVRLLKVIGLSAVLAAWHEGTGAATADKAGATFLGTGAGRTWSGPGSDLTDVTFKAQGAVCGYRELHEDDDGWFSVDVPLSLVRAMRDGQSDGMAVSDEKGQTMANNDIYSREQSGSAPYLVVKTAPGPDEATLQPRLHSPGTGRAVAKAIPLLLPAQPAAPTGIGPQIAAHGLSLTVLYETDLDPARAVGSPWDGSSVRLSAARGETVAFVLSLDARMPRKAVSPRWASDPRLRFQHVYWLDEIGGIPEVCVPVSAPEGPPPSRRRLLYLEATVPHHARTGPLRTFVVVATQTGTIRLPVLIEVSLLDLPDQLGFEVSLNTYGTMGGPYGLSDDTATYLGLERLYHRLAHEHRSTLAVLGYSHSGSTSTGYAPPIAGAGSTTVVQDWTAWDAHFGPYLNGSAFTGLPRGPVPVSHLYLPIHENWPATMEAHYRYTPTARAYPDIIVEHAMRAPTVEAAFDGSHGDAIVAVLRQIADHARTRGWSTPRLQFYLNNKHYYRDPAQGGRGVSWWLLDEPMSRDDWLAIAYFARLNRRAGAGQEHWPITFREDVSRPQWQRGLLDGLVDLMVVGEEMFAKPALIRDMKARVPTSVWNYGEASPPSFCHTWAEAWALRAWLTGADGIVPWQSVGDLRSLESPDPTALIVPGVRYGLRCPLATVRLKALRRAQQTMEYMVQCSRAIRLDRTALATALGTSPGAPLGNWPEARYVAMRRAIGKAIAASASARP